MIFSCAASIAALGTPADGPSVLGAGSKIEAGGTAIDIRVGHLVPCVADWNGDGKQDLIVGQFDKGKIRLYLNEGSNKEPVLNDFEYLRAGGTEISLPAG